MVSDYTPPPTNAWSKLLYGKPGVTVSPIGLATPGVKLANNGADYGPDTPGTMTSGGQEALSSLSATGGNVVFLSGNFSWSTYLEVNVSNVQLIFASGAKIILPANMWSLLNGNGQNFPPVIWVHNCTNVIIDNPCIDGTANQSTFSGGIFAVAVDFGSSNITVRDAYVTNINLWPYFAGGAGLGGITGTPATYVKLIRCTANASGTTTGADGGGFKFDGGLTNALIEYPVVTNTNFFAFDLVMVSQTTIFCPIIYTSGITSANQPLIYLENIATVNAVPSNVDIISPHITDYGGTTTRSTGIFVFCAGHGIRISDPYIQGCNTGISIEQGTSTNQGSGYSISGGLLLNQHGPGLFIGAVSGQGDGNVDGITVTGLRCTDIQTTKTQTYGLQLFNNNTTQSTVKNVYVGHCDFRGNANSGVALPSASGRTIDPTNQPSTFFGVWLDHCLGSDLSAFWQLGFSINTPSFPASATNVQNAFLFRVRIYLLTAGTMTAYQITDPSGNVQTITTASFAGQEFILDPGASIQFTYTTAPTWKWYGI